MCRSECEQTSNSESQLQCRKRVVGFDAKNKDSLSLYICHICTLILRYPYQLACGHRFCESCLAYEEGSIIKCRKCNEESSRERIILDRGCQHDMEKLNIICSLCEWNGIFMNYEEHLKTNHFNLFCEHCGQEFESVDSLNQHKFACERITIDCILKPYGCHEKFFRMNTQEHLLSEQHQRVLLQLVTRKSFHPINSTDNQQLTTSHTTISDETSHTNLQQLYETLELLVGGIQALNDDTQRITSDALHYQNTLEFLSEEQSKVKVAIQETNSFLNAHKSNQQILEQDLASMQQQIEDMKNTSYDGTLMWKITNVQQKIADAQSERQTSIYSPVFYSSPNGYKMRARLYMAGDGNARRTHMSIFFVLMRGEYDAVLHFPFSFKVSFCLFDQTTQQRHIIDSFRPDIKSNSFQRPRSDMNIASGIPKFLPLTMIQQDNNPYVRDDAMFIKILVDFGNIPKTVLPYILSLNPGLPILIQEECIKRELAKRAQGDLLNASQMTKTTQGDVRANENATTENMIQ